MAAYLNGIDKMPVLIIGNPPRQQDLREIYRNRSEKLKELKAEREKKHEESGGDFELPDDLLIEDIDLDSIEPQRDHFDCDKDYRRAMVAYKKRSDGGPGSGNFNHEGRPGEVVGSGPADGSPADQESAKAQGRAFAKMTKRRANDMIGEIADGEGSYDEKAKKIKEILKDLPIGSKIQTPGFWNDDGKPDTLIWDGSSWATKKDWEHGGWSCDNDTLISYWLDDDKENRPTVTSVAMTKEAYQAALDRQDKANWRRQAQVWKDGRSFGAKMTIKLRKNDLENCGDGFQITGSDGQLYEKHDDDWTNVETGEIADKRVLKSPTFTGDFFAVNFGMNGVSAEECRKMSDVYDGMDEKVQARYEQIFRNAEFVPSLSGGAYFMNGRIHFTKQSDVDTILHECAHAFDEGTIDKEVEYAFGGKLHATSASGYLDMVANPAKFRAEDFEAMAKVVGFRTDGTGWFDSSYKIEQQLDGTEYCTEAFEQFNDFIWKYNDVPGISHVGDAISALTLNVAQTEWFSGGHSQEYWKRPFSIHNSSSRSKEYWANYCSMRVQNCYAALELLEKITPHMFKACEEIWEEAFGDE